MKTGSRLRQTGFAYYGLLFSVAAAAMAATAGSHLLGNEMRREKEVELLGCGDEIRRAIESYHGKNTGGMYPFPTRLEWLVRDPHQLILQRHLRRICLEPMQERGPDGMAKLGGWGLILDANNQIVGVHSESMREPLKRAGFTPPYEDFQKAKTYADWRFIAAGGVPAKANERNGGAGANFIPSGGGLLTPFVTAPPPPPPAPPAAAVAPEPVPAAAPPRPAPEPVPRAAPAAAPEATPVPPAPAAVPAAARPDPVAGSGAAPATSPAPASTSAPAPAPSQEAPSGGVQPFVMQAPAGW
jgi:hypothetical protein